MPYHLYKSNTRRQSWKSLTRNRIKSRKKAYVACDTSRFCRDSNPHSRGRFRVFELYAVRRRRCCAMRRRVQGTRPAGNERNASLTNATVERNPQGTPFPRRSAPPYIPLAICAASATLLYTSFIFASRLLPPVASFTAASRNGVTSLPCMPFAPASCMALSITPFM